MRRTLALTFSFALLACGTTGGTGSDGSGDPLFVGDGGGTDGAGDGTDTDSGAPDPDAGNDVVERPDTDPGTDADPGTDTAADLPAPEDSQPQPDSTADGSTQVCEPGSSECDGDELVLCSEDGTDFARTRCGARGQYCGVVNGDASCLDRICEPDSLFCEGDMSVICNSRGSDWADAIACDTECDPETGRCAEPPPPVCDDPTLSPLTFGTNIDFNLCGAGDEYDNIPGDIDCIDARSRGEDRIFAFHLDAPTTIHFDLRDNDSGAAIDTVLYLLRSCADPASQVLCRDDVPCGESEIDSGCDPRNPDQPQPRQSTMEVELDPGDWFLVADQYSYSMGGGGSFSCGGVRLRADIVP